MTIPTRLIERDEFHAIIKQEGDILPLFKLTAHPFDPPRPGGPRTDRPELVAVNVLLVNVSEPCLYKDEEAHMAFVLMNGYDTDGTYTYENFQDCHIIKGAWYYRLAPNYWEDGDPEYDLDEAILRFDHGNIPAWQRVGD